MSTSTIQSDINAVYNTQQSNQFGTQRYELMFEPGTYNVSVPVGFYTEVVGLGQNPTQTVITGGGIFANAAAPISSPTGASCCPAASRRWSL